MKLIVGLGNYGKEYDNTRHNIGFRFLDAYLSVTNVVWKNKFKGLYCEKTINNEKVIFLKPQTYMNLSGESVILFVNYFKIKIEDILVISDDLALPIGTYRLRSQGSAGGHNGIKDIIRQLGTQKFLRIKVGVGAKPKGWDLADYVLGRFSDSDRRQINEAIAKAGDAVEIVISRGADIAMNEYNKKTVSAE